MGNPRPFVGDELKPEFEQEILDFIEKYGNSQRFIAYNSAEEPDWHKSKTPYPTTMTTLARTEAKRRGEPTSRFTWLCLRLFARLLRVIPSREHSVAPGDFTSLPPSLIFLSWTLIAWARRQPTEAPSGGGTI